MPSDPTADPEQSAPDRRLVLAAATAARLAPRRDEAPPPEDWRRVVTAIRTYRWLVIAVTGVGTLAGIIGARFLKPTYQARATVWLEIPDPSAHERDQGPFQSGQLLGKATGWLDLLRSHVVLDDVVRQWRLYLKPQSAADSAALATLAVSGDVRPGRYRLEVAAAANHFRLLDVDAKVVLQEGAVGDSVGAALGFTWVPPAAVLRPGVSVQFTVATTSEAAQKLSEELRVRAGTDGNFVRIERRGPDAAVVTRTVNAVAERFVAAAADLKRQRLTGLPASLKDQLRRAETNPRAAEAAARHPLPLRRPPPAGATPRAAGGHPRAARDPRAGPRGGRRARGTGARAAAAHRLHLPRPAERAACGSRGGAARARPGERRTAVLQPAAALPGGPPGGGEHPPGRAHPRAGGAADPPRERHRAASDHRRLHHEPRRGRAGRRAARARRPESPLPRRGDPRHRTADPRRRPARAAGERKAASGRGGRHRQGRRSAAGYPPESPARVRRGGAGPSAPR